jgi:hypothetical protein
MIQKKTYSGSRGQKGTGSRIRNTVNSSFLVYRTSAGRTSKVQEKLLQPSKVPQAFSY